MNILLVDGDEITRNALNHFLRLCGYDCRSTGKEQAVQALEEERPSILLLQMQTPTVDDLELIRNMNGKAGGEEVTTVMIVGRSRFDESEAEAKRQYGVNHVIFQPLNGAEVIEKLMQYK